MKAAVAVFVAGMFAVGPAAADPLKIDLNGNMRMVHPNPAFQDVPIEPAFEDYMYMMFDVCDAVEIKCLIYPMMGEIGNAVAAIYADGTPMIIYDRRLNTLIGGDGAHAVIAHELGHHYCGHLTDRKNIAPHQMETEADSFMGLAMRKLGTSLEDLNQTYLDLGIDQASSTHPAFAERSAAITAGYNASSLQEICVSSGGANP
ncbi:MAG: hypothetical protein ACK4P8_00280 [Tabrizicola sp.]